MDLLYLALVQMEAGDSQMHQVSAPHSPIVLPLCNNKMSTQNQFTKNLHSKYKYLWLIRLVNYNKIAKWRDIMLIVKLGYQADIQIVNSQANFWYMVWNMVFNVIILNQK